jgi:hypothetical protein
MPTFVPKDVDVLVWESAVNDSDEQCFAKISNAMVKCLEQIDWQQRLATVAIHPW